MPGKFQVNFDEIRSQINIVDVVSSYIPLTRRGKNFLGVCPFHDDTSPSLTVSPERQIYTCFACHATGNAFTFIRDFEKIPFMEAVKKAATIANIQVPELEKSFTQVISDSDQKLYKLLGDAQNYYNFNLSTAEGQVAQEYLKARHLDETAIRHFGIGYALDDGNRTVKYLQAKGHDVEDIILAGIATRTSNGIMDTLRGRLIFPIYDGYNRVIAFSGRLMKKSDNEPKYINTTETPLFTKGKVLYNLYHARQSAKKEKAVYIVEGFMDAIALFRGGIESAVASMGTALTQDHVFELRKLGVEIYLCLDGDQAGQTATIRTMGLFDKAKLKYKIIKPFTSGKDADEIINQEGKEGLLKALSNYLLPMDYRLYQLKNRYNLENYEDKRKFIIEASDAVANSLAEEFDIDHYAEEIAHLSDVSKNHIIETIQKRKSKQFQPSEPNYNEPIPRPDISKFTRGQKSQRLFIQKMLKSDLAAHREYMKGTVHLYDQVCMNLAIYINALFKTSTTAFKEADLYSHIEEPNLIKELQEITTYDNPIDTDELIRIINESLEEDVVKEKKKEIELIPDQIQQAAKYQELNKKKKKQTLQKE